MCNVLNGNLNYQMEIQDIDEKKLYWSQEKKKELMLHVYSLYDCIFKYILKAEN